MSGLRNIFKTGYQYKRAGIFLDGLVPEQDAPAPLFADERREGLRRLVAVLDPCDAKFGGGSVKCGLFPSSV